MESKRKSGLLIALTGVLGSLLLASVVRADSGKRVVPVTIKTGESYVIKDLSAGATPAVHVIENPNALVVHSESAGELTLEGAGEGEWSIDVKNAAGEPVNYEVEVLGADASAAHPAAGSAKAPVPAESAKGLPPVPAPAPAHAAAESGTKLASAAADTAPATSSESHAAAVAPAAGAAGLTAAAVGTTAPAAADATTPPAASSSTTSAPTTLAENSGSGTPLPPVSTTAAAPPAASAPTTMAPSSPVIPSQAAQMPEQLPTQKFRDNPSAPETSPSESGPSGTNYLPDDVVLMMIGSSRIFDFPTRIRRISIADTGVADVQVINPYQINLVAHQPGFTTLAVWDTQGRYQERQIRVDPHGKQQVMLNVIVAELNRSRLEQTGFNWTAALPKIEVSAVGLNPGPATPYTAATSLTPTTIINPGSAQQVTVSETAQGTLPPGGVIIPLLLSPTMNYGITAQNSNFQTQAFWNYLENHNLAKILAEPHLLANSGEKAEFLSGGEIPIVVAQALNTSIVFKQFGTSVIFVPTVVGKNDVELEVKPEVSEPDFAHGVNLFGFTVPAFVTRRAETYVRLKNDQTLIIAGLILHTKTSEVDKTPYLGDVPWLGTLFKRTSYNDTESDLVMSVTPQMVEPLPNNGVVALPTDRGPMTTQEIRTERLPQPDASRPRF